MHKSIVLAAWLSSSASFALAEPAQEAAGGAGDAAFMVVNVKNDDVLNIRSGPSADFGVVGEIQPGTRGVTITGACKSTWCPVQHQSASGWVKRQFLAKEEAAPVSAVPVAHGRESSVDLLDPLRPGGVKAPGQASAVEASKEPAQAAFVYFRSQGWAEHQAAGIVGNLQAECGPSLNCSIASGGLAQWRAERVTRFRQVFGYPFAKATFKDQLAYIQWELTHPESPWKDSGRILRGATDAASAASLFDIHYERSSGGARGVRIGNARALLRKYGGKPAS